MNRSFLPSARRLGRALGLVALGAILTACERPPVDTVQSGYRGTGMAQVYNPRLQADQVALNTAPEATAPASPDGPKASQVYQNVKVLGHLSVAEFARTMAAMTAWVAPAQGCVYCHNPQNFADDSIYTKIVSRRMLEMTQTINADYKNHVANTGVTCYTCHRGKNIPDEVWFKPIEQARANTFAGNRGGQNEPIVVNNLSSLPTDPFTAFFLNEEPIRVAGIDALPNGNRQSIKQTEWTYSLMIHMSKSLGVNCTQCHNTRSLGDWENSTPQRVTAYHGIRMVRDLNNAYMLPLTDTFPASRRGPGGDVAKANCATCHQGAHKPLYGAPMAKDYPELLTKTTPSTSAALSPHLSADDIQWLNQTVAPSPVVATTP